MGVKATRFNNYLNFLMYYYDLRFERGCLIINMGHFTN